MNKNRLIASLVILSFIFLSGNNRIYAQTKGDSAVVSYASPDSGFYFKEHPELSREDETSFFGYLVRVIVVTGILIVMIILGFQWYRKNVFQKFGPARQRIKILGRQAVGPKQFIVITAIEGHKYALGVTDHAVQMLADLGVYEESEESRESPPLAGTFTSVLKKFTRGQNE